MGARIRDTGRQLTRGVVQIRGAAEESDYQVVRELFSEYAASLGFGLEFQDFETELASLPGEYSPPGGCVLLAEVGGEAMTPTVGSGTASASAESATPVRDGRRATVGCVALRPFSPGVCEMKRLYVRSDRRGLGIGLALSRAVIEQARKRGYGRMRLDTVASMVEATRLYETLGFREIRPYRHNPVPGARFFELDLHSAGAQNSRRRQASRPRGGR